MRFCNKRRFLRIGSNPAFYLSIWSYTKERFVVLYFKKTHHPALGLFHNRAWVACWVESNNRKKKILHIKKKNDGERGQVLRMKSNNRLVISDSGRRAVLFITGTTITVHLEQGKQLWEPISRILCLPPPPKNLIKSSCNNQVFGFVL